MQRLNKNIIHYREDHVFTSLSTRSWSCFVGTTTNKSCQPITSMHLDSSHTLKTIGCIRWECGVFTIIIFHMQGMTSMWLRNHSIATWNKLYFKYSSNNGLGFHRIDWPIFHLVGDVLFTISMVCNASFLGMWKTRNKKALLLQLC